VRGDAATATVRRCALSVVIALTVLLVAFPLLRLIQTTWRETSGDLTPILHAPGLGDAVRNTVVLAALVTTAAVPGGTILALALRRADVPARTLWHLAVLSPLLVPDFVLAYSWTQAYGRAGFIETLTGSGWDGLLGPAGVAVVVAVNAVPLAYLVIAVGLATRAEPSLERAARASGAAAWVVLRTVTLPLLRPALAAAGVLVFVLTLATFAIPLVMGAPAGFSTVTTRIYANLSLGGDPFSFVEAIALALLLVVLAGSVVVPADALLAPRLRNRRPAVSEGAVVAVGGRGGGRWIAGGIACYVLATVVLPLVALVAAAITKAVGVPPVPSNWTLDNFAEVATGRTFEAIARSVGLAAVAATLLTVLGASVAVLERRGPGRWLSTLVTSTLVLPGSTLAVALLISYGRWLGNTLTLILLAYIAKLWALAHRPISGALDRLPPEELHAARASGAPLLTAIRTVVLRPLAPALLGAWLVCFLTALHEVTMSSLLYGPGSETLAVVVLNSQELGTIGPTAALSVLLTLLLVVPAALLWLVIRVAQGGPASRTGSPTGEVLHVP
jgi:iron(III) transport system permease protein